MEPSNSSRIADTEFSSGSDSDDLGFVIVHRHRDGIYDKKDGDSPCVDLRLISSENSVSKDGDLASDGHAAGKSASDDHLALIRHDECVVTFGSSVSRDEITVTEHDDCCFHGNGVADENLTIIQPNGHGYQVKNIFDGDLNLIPSTKQYFSRCGSGASNNFENEDHGFVLNQDDTIAHGPHILHAIETSTTDRPQLDDTSAEPVNVLIDASSAVEADMLEDTKVDGINGLKNCCISETDEEDDIFCDMEGYLIEPLEPITGGEVDTVRLSGYRSYTKSLPNYAYDIHDDYCQFHLEMPCDDNSACVQKYISEDCANFISIFSADKDEHKTQTPKHISGNNFSRDFYDSQEFDNEMQKSLNASRAMQMMQYLTKSQLQCMAEYCGLGHNNLGRDDVVIIEEVINWRQERGDFRYNKHSDNCFESDIEDLSFIPFEMDGVTIEMLRMCFLKCDLQHECLLRSIPYESSHTKEELISKLMKFKNDTLRNANTFVMLQDSSK